MKRHENLVLCLVALAGLLLFAGLIAGYQKKPQDFHGTDVSGVDYAQDFDLIDQDGRERTLADFRGKVVMMFFGFTHCPDACPTALARFRAVEDLLGPLAGRTQVLFVTVDPERDTPDLLKAYMQAFDPAFLALRGDAARTADVARHFKVFYRTVPTGSGYTMDHSTMTYAYDPTGRLRLVFTPLQSAQAIADDVRLLLQAGR